jgi:hypothetical protein
MFIGAELIAANHQQWLLMWWMELLPLTICSSMCLVHIYYFTLLASYFQYIQQELEEVVKIDRILIAQRLEATRDIYGLLFQVSENGNAIFIWSQAFNFSRLFLHYICDLHWLCSLSSHITVILLLLLHDANLCVERSRKFAPLLFRIKIADDEMALQKIVRLCGKQAIEFS